MSDNQTPSPLEQRLALSCTEQLAILVTFQAGAKYHIKPLEIADRFHNAARDAETQTAWRSFQEELGMGRSFAGGLAETGFFSKDVLRIMNILVEQEPAVDAAVAYLSAVIPRKP
ncbi:hypothetical protein ABH908_000321 [Pseudomonas frederiksbergensis]|uniref:hypothetical protein n=1 Tax=Pseudomonas TaxID=286 RepID=UPI003D1B2F91